MIEHKGQILFNHRELRCPRTKAVELAPGFAEELKELRVSFDRPMIVNSCCRSKEYNTDLRNSHPRSLHVYDFPFWPTQGTAAIDISIAGRDTGYVEDLINLAWYMGWSIGIYPASFLHLDRRSDFISDDNPKKIQTKFWYGQ